jgi:hypothetical protein
MGQGFTVNADSLAIRVGELRELADAVESAALVFGTTGNLGPGDLTSAVQEVSEQWYEGLGKMRDKINDMAGNLDNAVTNYRTLDQGGHDRMDALVDRELAAGELNTLRAAAAVQLTQQRDLLAGG